MGGLYRNLKRHIRRKAVSRKSTPIKGSDQTTWRGHIGMRGSSLGVIRKRREFSGNSIMGSGGVASKGIRMEEYFSKSEESEEIRRTRGM